LIAPQMKIATYPANRAIGTSRGAGGLAAAEVST
jgi:hypothetical protein